ncbi:hypothetical protein P7C73_g2657, partial [Tremellales sp. Uapishka_1]
MSAPTTLSSAEAAAKALFEPYRATNNSLYLLALCVDLYMLGVMVQQVVQWYTFKRDERRVISALVLTVTVWGFIMTGLIMAINFDHFAVHFGEYLPFESTQWTCFWPFCDTVVATTVQIFYLERAFKLNHRNWLLVGVVAILWPAAWASSLATLIIYGGGDAESSAAAKVTITENIWFGSMMAIDILITASIGWGLYKSRTGWEATDRMITKLVMISVETQLPPTLMSVVLMLRESGLNNLISTLAFLIEYSIFPASFMGIFLECIQSKFYIVGFLAVLNSRHHLRRDDRGGQPSWDQKTNTYAMKGSRLQMPQQATINVTTETYTESDSAPAHDKPKGINRYDFKEVDSEPGSAHGLDYSYNESKTGLTDTIVHLA